jgi:UDP-N-acetylmuramoylalanine--D-glutamate ligase
VLISDSGTIKKVFKNILLKNNIDFEENGHQRALSLNFNLIVKSPGISDSNPVVINLIKKNIPIISEIEFAFGFTNSNIIGITGSNGKTTVSSLIFDILKRSEMDVDLVGNIGKSFASSVSFSPDRKNFVIEISSFQLDGIKKFNPHIAVLLNLSADHLDRYNNNYDNYINSKFRIVMNQTSSDYFIYDNDDKEIIKFINNNSKKIKSIHLPFSLSSNNETVTHIENKNIISIINKKKIIMPINNFQLKGQHNLKNAMAATTVAHLLKIRKETIRKSLEHFQAVEHRLEHVLKINKVNYINDSKATNVNATYFALDSMESSTIWIVGGVDKGNEYEELFSLVNEKVKAIICLGKNNSKILNCFENVVEYITEAKSMQEAVNIAYNIAKEKDNVLLSPACASFDLFDNYEDRGRQFKSEVRKL